MRRSARRDAPGLGAVIESRADHEGFPYYDRLLLRLYRLGAVLPLSGIALGLIGVWRPGPLRWHAPACTLGIFLFWLTAAASE